MVNFCTPFLTFILFIIIFMVISTNYNLKIINNIKDFDNYFIIQSVFFIIWLYFIHLLCKKKKYLLSWIFVLCPMLLFIFSIVSSNIIQYGTLYQKD